MSAAATRSLMMRLKVAHLLSLDSIMTMKKKGVKGEEEIGESTLFTENPRRVVLGNQPVLFMQRLALVFGLRYKWQQAQVTGVSISWARRAKCSLQWAAGGYSSSPASQPPLFLCTEMNFRQILFSETQDMKRAGAAKNPGSFYACPTVLLVPHSPSGIAPGPYRM